MTLVEACENGSCQDLARWFVGLSLGGEKHRGHFACDRHLAECCMVTLYQLNEERFRVGGVSVVPVKAMVLTDG
jgi:hypothetical protein